MKSRLIASTLVAFSCLSLASCADTPESRLQALDITLVTKSAPVANYVSAVRSGNLIFLAGHLPKREDGALVTGKLGDGLATQEGYDAARLTAIALITTLKSELGELSKVKRIVKVSGMVNATPDYTEHSQVINGCSDLLVEVFGDRGRHARVACGYASLPLNAAVEIDLIVEVE